jgi:hypothetical protein
MLHHCMFHGFPDGILHEVPHTLGIDSCFSEVIGDGCQFVFREFIFQTYFHRHPTLNLNECELRLKLSCKLRGGVYTSGRL